MKNMRGKAVFSKMAGCVGVCVLMAVLWLMPGNRALADDFTWTNAAGGSFEVLSNWTVGGNPAAALPGASDKIVNFTSGDYAVGLSGDATVDSVLVNVGYVPQSTSVTLDMGGNTLTATTGFSMIDVRIGEAKVILTNGMLKCNTAHNLTTLTGISVAYAEGSNRSGKLTVIGPDTQVQGVGNLVVAGTDAEMSVLAGAQMQMGGSLWLHQVNDVARISGSGTVVGLGNQLTADGPGCTMLIDDGAALTAQGISLGYASNLVCRIDNATATLTNLTFNIGYRCTDSLAIVTNNATVSAMMGVQMSGDSATRPSVNGRLVVADGGSVLIPTGRTLSIGRDYSRGATLELNNGQVQTGYVEFGGYSNPVGTCSNSVLHVSGADSLLKATSVLTYGTRHTMLVRYGARLEFVVPQDGFTQTPVQLIPGPLVTAHSQIAGYEDVPNTLFVDANAWARAHPGETLALIASGGDSSAGFAELIANATLPFTNPDRICTLSISADNKSLLLTAPRERGTILCVQ